MRAAFCWSKANEVEGRNAGSVHSSPGLVVSSRVHACAETTSRAPSPDRASQRRMSVLMRSTSGLSTWQGAEGENGQAAVSRAERNRKAAQRCFTAVAWCRSWAPIGTHCCPSTAHPSTANRSALPATQHPHLPRLLAVQEGLDAARNLAGVLVVAQAHGRAKLHGWGWWWGLGRQAGWDQRQLGTHEHSCSTAMWVGLPATMPHDTAKSCWSGRLWSSQPCLTHTHLHRKVCKAHGICVPHRNLPARLVGHVHLAGSRRTGAGGKACTGWLRGGSCKAWAACLCTTRAR